MVTIYVCDACMCLLCMLCLSGTYQHVAISDRELFLVASCEAWLQVLRHGIECFGAASSAAWLHHARYGSLPWVSAGRLSAVTVPGVYVRGEKYMT